MKLIEFFEQLKRFYNSKKYIKDDIEDISDYYYIFLDFYSNLCDFMILNDKNNELLLQVLIFYYRFNICDELDILSCVKIIIESLENNEDILNYEFKLKKEDICDFCLNEGDIPECILCGKTYENKE